MNNNGDIYDLFAGVVWAVIFFVVAGTARLAYGEDTGNRSRTPWINAAIVLGLLAVSSALLLVGNRRLMFTTSMLVVVAFNLGHWRGARQVERPRAPGVSPLSARAIDSQSPEPEA